MTFPEKCIVGIGLFFLLGVLEAGGLLLLAWWTRWRAERRAVDLIDRHRIGL